MKHLFLLVSAFLILPSSVNAGETSWKDYLQRAEDYNAAEKADHMPRGLKIIVALRRAWIAVPDNNLDAPAYDTLRKKIIQAYTIMNLPQLAKWYEDTPIAEIDKKIRENFEKGKAFYLDDWHARMDEFGQITIWKLSSIKPHQEPTVFYYKPGDEMYPDALILSKLQPKEEKSVDFDLSSFVYVGGPTFGPGTQIDW